MILKGYGRAIMIIMLMPMAKLMVRIEMGLREI